MPAPPAAGRTSGRSPWTWRASGTDTRPTARAGNHRFGRLRTLRSQNCTKAAYKTDLLGVIRRPRDRPGRARTEWSAEQVFRDGVDTERSQPACRSREQRASKSARVNCSTGGGTAAGRGGRARRTSGRRPSTVLGAGIGQSPSGACEWRCDWRSVAGSFGRGCG
jgi:hypothetical protein